MDLGFDFREKASTDLENPERRSVTPGRSWKNTDNIRGKCRKEMTDNFDPIHYS